MSTSYNISNTGLNAMSSMANFSGVIGVVGLAAVVMFMVLVFSSLERFKWFVNIINKLGVTYHYFKYGLSGWGLIGGFYGLYIGLSVEGGNGFPILKWVGVIFGLYALTCLMGYPMKKLINRVKGFNQALKPKVEVKSKRENYLERVKK